MHFESLEKPQEARVALGYRRDHCEMAQDSSWLADLFKEVATLVLIIFVVYVANLGKMINVEGQDEYIADEGNAEKFRFVAQLSITRLHKTFTPKSLQY